MLRQLTWKFAAPILLFLSLTAYFVAPYIDGILSGWFRADVELRSRLVFNSMEYSLLNLARDPQPANLAQYLHRLTADERLQAIVVCATDGALIQKTPDTPDSVRCSTPARPDRNMTVEGEGGRLHMARFVAGAGSAQPLEVILVHNLSFIDRRQVNARDYMLAVIAMVSLIAVAVAVGVAWVILKLWIRSLVGDIRKKTFLGELSSQAGGTHEVMMQVRSALRELETAQRLEIDYRENWTPEALKHLVREQLHSPEMIVVSNREPYVHNRTADGSVSVSYPASGMVTAIEPVIRACEGLWLAHGSGAADRETVDAKDRIKVPPHAPEYTLQRVWLNEAEEEGYYYGYSNEGLWSLCHLAHVRPIFRDRDWEQYQAVNAKFADAIARAARTPNPVILVQDFHLALLPHLIRKQLPGATIALFWHIPWPSAEAFGICPQRQALLQSMISADIVGFHTRYHCQNFLSSVDRFAETNIDHEQMRIRAAGRTCQVAPYPISIEWPPVWLDKIAPVRECRENVVKRLGIGKKAFIGVGVERWDFTKGVLERFEAIEYLLGRTPELIGKLVFIQIAAPTRSRLPAYVRLQEETRAAAERLNARFSRDNWTPLILLDRHHEPQEVFEYLRACDFCVVNSLHDGMNLVAKEFVAARDDERGVLILSTFAGASRELIEALIVNPYDIPATADAIEQAWKMSAEEQSERMRLMRRTVKENNVYRWAGHMLSDVSRVRQHQRIESMRKSLSHRHASHKDSG
ncbi:MAG: trehalose-6-phosphate synthase [Betaproteobacteria bacterium]|nr:trehalose-6-phosphate synthase [Betaproteobacteria bacterium]